jgi:hypothetical protein
MEIPTPDVRQPNSRKTRAMRANSRAADLSFEIRPDLHGAPASTSTCRKRPLAYALLFQETVPKGKKAGRGRWAAMRPNQSRPIDEVLRRVQGEFLEMPGLRLTEAQACRLWGLDTAVCDALLGALVDAKFLFKTRDGAFMKVEQATPMKASIRSRYAGAA